MKNKYLFLDFDGILNSNKNYRTLQMLGIPTRDEYGTIFDPQYVECLRDIIDIFAGTCYLQKCSVNSMNSSIPFLIAAEMLRLLPT